MRGERVKEQRTANIIGSGMRNSPHGGLWDQKLIKWLGLIRNSNDPIEAIAVIGTPLELNHPTRKKVGPTSVPTGSI